MGSFHILSEASLVHLAVSYGAWAVFLSVMVESTGVPVPSESILVAVAALAAGSDPHAPAITTVVLAAIAGAVIGDNFGYAIGRGAGRRILARFGPRIGLGPDRQRLGRYLFQRYGGRVVIVARFVSVLRTAVSLLAGTTRMPWPRFLACNIAGAVVWAGAVGGGAYLLGQRVRAWSWPASLALLAVAAAALVVGAVLLKRRGAELQAEADRMLSDAPAGGSR
ncbi:DedA family protein [Methylobacterium sp. 092160098-2]|uniref:DedA family protein n=1 Tax=Methylobacterium sp. 092160098-2 TaxID=3025129 RepID=UPI0023819547|nr:DedA family protein [Methylobacterium sp. 092160098-2]MDE4915013.1 DedA family protein [Methylobacterium sp. 092160098-2]